MEITEKVYVEALEKMVKKHKENLCEYCPGQEDEGFNTTMRQRWCKICGELFIKYIEEKEWDSCRCPCHYFKGVFWEKEMLVPEGYMIKIAWKMIRGWKKDNK